jgi:response regulator NasT
MSSTLLSSTPKNIMQQLREQHPMHEVEYVNTLIYCNQQQVSDQFIALLKHSEYQVTFCATNRQELLNLPLSDAPSLLLMSVEQCNKDILNLLRIIQQQRPMPVVVFTEQYDDEALEQAIEIGVSAYIVDGLRNDRLLPVLKLARTRFRKNQLLLKQLDDLKTTLAERKIIDRAKNVIMQQRHCTEEEAYRLLRTSAMNQNLRLATLAQNIVTTAQLLDP